MIRRSLMGLLIFSIPSMAQTDNTLRRNLIKFLRERRRALVKADFLEQVMHQKADSDRNRILTIETTELPRIIEQRNAPAVILDLMSTTYDPYLKEDLLWLLARIALETPARLERISASDSQIAIVVSLLHQKAGPINGYAKTVLSAMASKTPQILRQLMDAKLTLEALGPSAKINAGLLSNSLDELAKGQTSAITMTFFGSPLVYDSRFREEALRLLASETNLFELPLVAIQLIDLIFEHDFDAVGVRDALIVYPRIIPKKYWLPLVDTILGFIAVSYRVGDQALADAGWNSLSSLFSNRVGLEVILQAIPFEFDLRLISALTLHFEQALDTLATLVISPHQWEILAYGFSSKEENVRLATERVLSALKTTKMKKSQDETKKLAEILLRNMRASIEENKSPASLELYLQTDGVTASLLSAVSPVIAANGNDNSVEARVFAHVISELAHLSDFYLRKIYLDPALQNKVDSARGSFYVSVRDSAKRILDLILRTPPEELDTTGNQMTDSSLKTRETRLTYQKRQIYLTTVVEKILGRRTIGGNAEQSLDANEVSALQKMAERFVTHQLDENDQEFIRRIGLKADESDIWEVILTGPTIDSQVGLLRHFLASSNPFSVLAAELPPLSDPNLLPIHLQGLLQNELVEPIALLFGRDLKSGVLRFSDKELMHLWKTIDRISKKNAPNSSLANALASLREWIEKKVPAYALTSLLTDPAGQEFDADAWRWFLGKREALDVLANEPIVMQRALAETRLTSDQQTVLIALRPKRESTDALFLLYGKGEMIQDLPGTSEPLQLTITRSARLFAVMRAFQGTMVSTLALEALRSRLSIDTSDKLLNHVEVSSSQDIVALVSALKDPDTRSNALAILSHLNRKNSWVSAKNLLEVLLAERQRMSAGTSDTPDLSQLDGMLHAMAPSFQAELKELVQNAEDPLVQDSAAALLTTRPVARRSLLPYYQATLARAS